jgi:hypothetical protein
VTGIFGCNGFTFKDVPKVTPAIFAKNLDTKAIGVRLASNGARYLIIKSRPSTVGLEFILGPIQGLVALTTNVEPGLKMVIIFAGERSFCTLLNNNPGLFRCELVSFICHGKPPVTSMQGKTES